MEIHRFENGIAESMLRRYFEFEKTGFNQWVGKVPGCLLWNTGLLWNTKILIISVLFHSSLVFHSYYIHEIKVI